MLLLARDLIRILFRDEMMSGSFRGGTASVSEPNCSLQSVSLSASIFPRLAFCPFSHPLHLSSFHRKKEQATTKKDRVTHCLTICENIVAQSLRYALLIDFL